jgi:transposase
MAKKLRKYTAEFRQEAVKLALNSPSISATAQELGLPEATLHCWVAKLKKTHPAKQEIAAQDVATLLQENRRFIKELARLKEEKEILKKAAAYFWQKASFTP